jgi:hypothetical protein
MTTATVNHMNMHTPSREEHYASNTKEKLTILPKGVKNIIFGMFHPEYISTMKKVQKNGRKLKKAPVELRDDIEIVITAVKQNGSSLKYASERLRNNKKVVLAAVQENTNDIQGSCLKYASKRLRDNKKVVLASIGGSEYKHMDECYSFKYASKRLHNDKKFVRKVLKKNIYQIEYLPRNSIVLDDEKTIRKILKYKEDYYTFFEHLSDRLKKNKSLFLEAVRNKKSDIRGLKYSKYTKDQKENHEIIKELGKNSSRQTYMLFWHYKSLIPDFFFDDINFVIPLLKISGTHLRFVSPRLRNNREVVKVALNENFSVELKNNKLVRVPLTKDFSPIKYASKEIKKEILKYCLTEEN